MTAAIHYSILLVDDNPGDAELLREAFEERGTNANIHWIEDGQSALDYLHDRKMEGIEKLPDLILLDVNLPRISGHEVLRQAKIDEVLQLIPIIVYSGSASQRDLELAYRHHANCYIVKPVNLEQFVHTARVIEEFWLNTVRLISPVTKSKYLP